MEEEREAYGGMMMMMIDGDQTEGHVRCNRSISLSQLTPNCNNVGYEARHHSRSLLLLLISTI
jgi:hypothetical protein